MNSYKYQLILVLTVLGTALPAFAQESASDRAPITREEIRELKELRENDPEAFREIVQQRRGQFRERLQGLRENNPEAFQQAVERYAGQRRSILQQLKQDDPEQFQRVMTRREAQLQERLQRVQAHDPEKYKRLQQTLENSRGSRLHALRENDPERFERLVQQRPGWQTVYDNWQKRSREDFQGRPGREPMYERRGAPQDFRPSGVPGAGRGIERGAPGRDNRR